MKRITLIVFVFLFHNIINGQCLGSQSYTLSPAGPYTAGQNVTVTYTLSNFIQVNVNWIIAFDIDYGNGWSNINPVSAPGNPGGSSGTWIWDTQNTYPSGLNFGPGYRFVNSSWFNPDWGTSSTGPFTLSFNLQVGNSCVNNDLSIDISVIGDCQTGGWNNGSCCPITPYSIYSGTSSGGTGAGNISIVENISDISCNGFSDGLINLNISGGIPPFSTLWSNTSTSQNISNLSAGTYTATITDNQGCTSSESYTLTDPPVFTPIINPSNVSCFGYNDGLIEVINEPASTTYLWSNTTTSSSISNIGSGNYSVDVFNMNGCLYTESFTITEPQQITVIATSNDVSCNGVNDGSIDLTISGGIPDYTINIPPYSQVLQNGGTNYFSPATLSANIYNYSVADANGCVVTDMITINEPSLLSVNPVITNVSCNGESSGAIVLNTTGGTSPYIEDFGGNNPLMLSDGTYSYTLTDANGCTISDNFSITEPDLLLFTSTTTDASCSGYSDGTANIIITGGTTPYNTNWNGQNPNALNAGNFPFTITDDNGCTNQGNITINEPAGMAVIINEVDVNCFGGNDGSAILTISGGAGAPYNIDWGGVDENNLTAGNFPVTITDINNCSTTGIATINEPSEIQTTSAINNVSCFGNDDGSVSLQISGGITPYTEDWFGINTNLLAPGNYPYQVVDGNSCLANGSVTITEPYPLEITSIDIIDIDCFGENTGSINPNVIGGTTPYSQDFGTFNPYFLTAGNYPFSIIDDNGCTVDSIATLVQAEQIFLDFIATSPICRYDESTLSIHISNAEFNSFTVSLQDSILKTYIIDTNGLLITNGMPIILTPNFSCNPEIISLTDENGCTAVVNDNVHIEVKQLPVLAINEADICIGTPSFILNNATPSGGTYLIEGNQNNYFDAGNMNPGHYNITYQYTDPITSCSNGITEILTISESPKAGMLFGPQPTDITDPNILFRDNSNEEVLISEWNLGDGTIIYDELSFWHTYAETGKYTIKYYITNLYGCTDSVINQLNINPIYSTIIPSAFTPNDDGDNDFFFPAVIGFNSYNMKIYDRWGGIIYNEDNGKWDGTSNYNNILNGIYSYSIKVLDFKNKPFIYTGTVNLLR